MSPSLKEQDEQQYYKSIIFSASRYNYMKDGSVKSVRKREYDVVRTAN